MSPVSARSIARSVGGSLASLQLTVALLSLSLVLVFAATLDQVNLGVWGVQNKYFHSFLVMGRIPGTEIAFPVFPGGYLLGGVLVANLVAAHLLRFRLSWRKSGIWLTHVGLIILIIGEGLCGILQRDGQIRMNIGDTRRYVESFRENELAVIDATNPAYDEVVSIPVDRLADRLAIQHPAMPFTLRALFYYPNAAVRPRSQFMSPPPAVATAGDGLDLVAEPVPVTTKPDETNWPTAAVELDGPEGTLGTWLVSTQIEEPQTLSYQGRTWRLVLRARRDYLPFALTLVKFTHDVYPGTSIPKNFASTVRLRDEAGRDDRSVIISMNNPLRTGGYAFYQAGYANDDRTSVLQAVRNPSWRIPYVSCAMIALGLVIQFGIGLSGFFRRRALPGSRPAPASP